MDQAVPINLTDSYLSNFQAYHKQFPYKGDKLFEEIYLQNKSQIKIKKSHVAISNLKRIFNEAIHLSAQIGFHEMSVRDLSNSTQISMGSIYSCITKKENIVVMVKNFVATVSAQYMQLGQQQPDSWSKLEATIRMQFYNSCILQPWLFFLYFETRSLPKNHQADSKKIELDTISNYQSIINEGVENGTFKTDQSQFVAHTILALIQDWYLKPWKNRQLDIDKEQYLEQLLKLMHSSLAVKRPVFR